MVEYVLLGDSNVCCCFLCVFCVFVCVFVCLFVCCWVFLLVFLTYLFVTILSLLTFCCIHMTYNRN